MPRGSSLEPLTELFQTLIKVLRAGNGIIPEGDGRTLFIGDSAEYKDKMTSVSQRLEIIVWLGDEPFKVMLTRTNHHNRGTTLVHPAHFEQVAEEYTRFDSETPKSKFDQKDDPYAHYYDD